MANTKSLEGQDNLSETEKGDIVGNSDEENWDEEEEESTETKENLKYKESRWGTLDQPQGYTFKSRSKLFNGALKSIKVVMRKGTEKGINDIKFRVLDSIIKNGSKEVLIEIKDGKEGSGKVSIKLFGPNKKKWSTIMVNKHKESDAAFVKLGALQIIKPLLEGILKGKSARDILNIKQTKSEPKEKQKEIIEHSCSFCDVRLQNKALLKSHVCPMEVDNPDYGIKKEQISKQVLTSEIPKMCKKYTNIGDMQYIVPGDGCCAPNCAATHLFQDVTRGRQLRREMNTYIADHSDYYKNKGYWCSEDSPFERECPSIKSGKVHFKNPEDLYAFLRFSEDGSVMWSDSEDLHVLANMYQFPIKVITYFTENTKEPTVNMIGLDPALAPYTKVQKGIISSMTLLHSNNTHFNLVINAQSH